MFAKSSVQHLVNLKCMQQSAVVYKPLCSCESASLATMPTYYPTHVVEAMQDLLYMLFCALPFSPSHPKHHFDTMTSGINCRAKGSEAATIGPNIEELHGAVAVELSPFPNQQRQQLDANLKSSLRVWRFDFAGPTGETSFLTWGASHIIVHVYILQMRWHRLKP